MKGLRNNILALLVSFWAPLLIWVGVGSALYQRSRWAKLFEKALPNWACAIDTDCPSGFVCVGGYCVPDKTPIDDSC